MRRQAPHRTKVIHCRNDSLSKQVVPDTIHKDTSSQRVVPTRNFVGQGKSITRLPSERFQKTRGNFLPQATMATTDVNMSRFWRTFCHGDSVSRTWKLTCHRLAFLHEF